MRVLGHLKNNSFVSYQVSQPLGQLRATSTKRFSTSKAFTNRSLKRWSPWRATWSTTSKRRERLSRKIQRWTIHCYMARRWQCLALVARYVPCFRCARPSCGLPPVRDCDAEPPFAIGDAMLEMGYRIKKMFRWYCPPCLLMHLPIQQNLVTRLPLWNEASLCCQLLTRFPQFGYPFSLSDIHSGTLRKNVVFLSLR